MTEVRQLYRIGALNPDDPSEINRYLKDIADRLDQLEGFRGQGIFKTAPKSEQVASGAAELIRLEEAQNTAQGAASEAASEAVSNISELNVVLSLDGLIVKDDDGTTIHSFEVE